MRKQSNICIHVRILITIGRATGLENDDVRNLLAIPLLLAALALLGTFFVDPWTALRALYDAVLAALALVVIAYVAPRLYDEAGRWLAKICLGAFCAAAIVLFTAWAFDWPKPIGCVVEPGKICVADVGGGNAGVSAVALTTYLFPSDSSGAADDRGVNEVDWRLVSRGEPSLPYRVLLNDPNRSDLRQKIVDGVQGWRLPM